MATTNRPVSGKKGKITLNGTTVKLKKWSVNPQSQDHDSTNFESEGFGEGLGGIREADVNFEGDWDSAQNPHDDPPNIMDGEVITDVRLYIDRDNSLFFDFDEIRIISVPVNQEVRGVCQISVSAKTNGEFSYPTGSV